MSYSAINNPEQWILLTVFFTIFAFSGFFKKPSRSTGTDNYIIPGILLLVANSLLLFMANWFGYGSYNVIQLLLLQSIPIESSFIVLGYCMIVRGLAIFLRYLFTPGLIKSRRTVL